MPTVLNPPYIGSLGVLGIAKEGAATFGTPVGATSYLPFKKMGVVKKPGLFDIKLARAAREERSQVAGGEQKISGAIDFPFYNQMGMALLIGAIGTDTEQYGTSPANATTLNGAVSAGVTSIVLTSATGYTINSFVQIDSTPNREVRKITNVSSNTLTLDVATSYAHANGVGVHTCIAPFNHAVAEANVLPSFTLEKNLGGFDSVQYAGSVMSKLSLKAATKDEVQATIDVIAQADSIIAPTQPTYTTDQPVTLAGVSATILSVTDTVVETMDLTIDNKAKERYTLSGFRYPTFIVPQPRALELKITEVLTGNWTTYYGDLQAASAIGTPAAGSAVITLNDGTNSTVLTLPQLSISELSDPIDAGSDIMITMTLVAWLGGQANTLSAVVQSKQYVGF